MQNTNVKKNDAACVLVFISGCLGIILVTALDGLLWNTDILAEGYPDFTQGHLVRSMVICASVAAILWSFMRSEKPELLLVDDDKFSKAIIWIWIVIAIDILFLALFVFNPELFSLSSAEDGPIEWGPLCYLSVAV